MKEKLSLMIIFMIVFLGSQIGATENKTKKIMALNQTPLILLAHAQDTH
jgi:hypothetical protein